MLFICIATNVKIGIFNNSNMQRLSSATFFILLSLAPLVKASERCPVPRTHVVSEEKARALAKRLTAAYRLTPVPVDCLDFNPDREAPGPAYEINVHEIHSEKCGGAIGLSPRVFTLKILGNGHITSDAHRTDGEYKSLTCPRRKHLTK